MCRNRRAPTCNPSANGTPAPAHGNGPCNEQPGRDLAMAIQHQHYDRHLSPLALHSCPIKHASALFCVTIIDMKSHSPACLPGAAKDGASFEEWKHARSLDKLEVSIRNRYQRDPTGTWRCPPGEAVFSALAPEKPGANAYISVRAGMLGAPPDTVLVPAE
jgi:hypothetical protein